MRVTGTVTHDADQTTTSNMLVRAAMLRPEIMTSSVTSMFEASYSTFASFLGRRGLTSSGLYAGMDTENFRVVGNRKVMWPVKGYPLRKGVIISNNGGSTPGLNGAEFTVVINTDFFSVNDNLELVDRDTLLHVLSKARTATGDWSYRVKLVHNRPGAFCDPTLVAAGKEIGFGHTAFPELSSDAGEKSTYGEWHAEWIGIQRMKHTISGTANAMKVWLDHGGVRTWDYQQNIDMYERWAIALEHQLLFGKSSVDSNDRVYVQDDLGRDLIQGNGIIAQGDPSLRFHYNNLTIRQLENVMENLQLQQTSDGMLEVAVCGGQKFYNEMQRLFRDVLQQNPVPMIEKRDDGLEINTAFSYYTFGGVRLHLMRCPAFDAPYRPIERDSNGNSNMSQRAFFASLGNTIGGQPNIELLTLGNAENDRRFVARVINGMAGDGPLVDGAGTQKMMLASSPVDGKQVHILNETGVVMRNNRGFAQLIKTRYN
jgi:hypothetical protein